MDANVEAGSKVEQLLCHIASRQRVASDARAEERRIAASRNSAECDALNSVTALAKELKESLSHDLAWRLTSELVEQTGWTPPVEVTAG